MSYSHQKQNQNAWAKKGAKKGLQLAKGSVKKGLHKLGKKAAKKLTKAAAKKIAGGILLKTAPIWGSLLALIFFVTIILTILTPDLSFGSKTNAMTTDKAVQEKISKYVELGVALGYDPKWILALDMVQHDNLDLLDVDPNDSAFHFFSIYYEKYEPEKTECVEYDEQNICKKSKTTPETILEKGTYKGKKEIQGFFKQKGLPTNDIVAALQQLRSEENVRVTTTALSPEFAFGDIGLTEDQQDYFNDIIESGLIEEEYPEFATYNNFGFGSGAYCSPNKAVNETSWNAMFTKGGVFSSYGPTFRSIAEKNGIDPVLFASIAFHETSYGTSPAVRNKNNPGGLMGNNGLMVFSTLQEGLESMGQTLHNRIIKDGLTTIDKLGSIYAPLGASNDPNNLNINWVPNVSKIASQFGGLTMNCEQYSNGLNIVFDGDVSETAQKIATVGTKWIGNSTYVFGGGRSQSDIARGWFDCSSFVHWAYAQAGINLGDLSSISTETLNKLGKRVSINDIKVGDLIFWNTYKQDGHVGIYIGNGKFIGCQSSTGVAIEDINSSYWKSVFSGHVRRILPDK
jgi:hypothetical protein